MADKPKKPVPPASPSDDLPPRGNLPDKSVIPEWQRFGYGAETVKSKGKKEEKKLRSGGLPDLTGDGKITRADVLKGRGVFRKGGAVKSSASKRADGIAQRGKTRGKMV